MLLGSSDVIQGVWRRSDLSAHLLQQSYGSDQCFLYNYAANTTFCNGACANMKNKNPNKNIFLHPQKRRFLKNIIWRSQTGILERANVTQLCSFIVCRHASSATQTQMYVNVITHRSLWKYILDLIWSVLAVIEKECFLGNVFIRWSQRVVSS